MDYFFDEDDEPNENIEVKDDMYNYKGYFVENEVEDEKNFMNLEPIFHICISTKD